MLPGVGSGTAKTLLHHFGNVKNIANSSEEEMLQVPGIGKKTAAKIQEIFNNKDKTTIK